MGSKLLEQRGKIFRSVLLPAVLSFLAIAAAPALAENPTMEFKSVTWVEMDSNYKTDFSTAKLNGYYINLHNLPEGVGTITLPGMTGREIIYRNLDDYFFEKIDTAVSDDFRLWLDEEGRYVPGSSDGTGTLHGFLSESALKDNDFTVKKLDGSPISIYAGPSLIDKIPQFMTTDEQLKNCAPYVELVTSGSQLTGVKWSFVKDKDPKTSADSSYIGSNYKMDISYMGWDGSKRVESFLKKDAALSGDVNFSFPADLGKVWYVSLQLMTNGTEASGGTVYEWVHLINPPAETPKVVFPIEAEVEAAKDAAASLLDSAPSSFEAAAQGSVISQTSITENKLLDEEIVSSTSSAIAFEQELKEKGGALVVGKLTLPYNDKSLSGESLPPLNAGNYKVFKHFKYGGWVNLSDLGIVDVSGDGAKITATLIIIDGEPGNESGVTKPVGGMDCCGVKLVDSGGEKYLFIYDGYEDGVALDPIALENYSAGGESGDGGGGCNAGIPLAGLLSLCGLALCLRKKH